MTKMRGPTEKQPAGLAPGGVELVRLQQRPGLVRQLGLQPVVQRAPERVRRPVHRQAARRLLREVVPQLFCTSAVGEF